MMESRESSTLYQIDATNDLLMRSSTRVIPSTPGSFGNSKIERLVGETTVTLPTRWSGRVFESVWNRDQENTRNRTLSVILPYPVTTVACIEPISQTKDLSEEAYYVQSDGSSYGTLGNISSIAFRATTANGTSDWYPDGQIETNFESIWFPSPEPASQSIIGVFFQHYSKSNKTHPLSWLLTESDPSRDIEGLMFTTCSISAYWNTAQVLRYLDSNIFSPVQTMPMSGMKRQNARNITFDLNDTDMLLGLNGQAFYIDAAALAMAFAVAISSSTDFDPDLVLSSKGPTQSSIQQLSYAYGYSARSTSVRLSLAVILAYCIITIAYMIYILITGLTSTAWNWAIELLALALQSKKPDYSGQGHTAVGINSPNTFKQGVGIRVNNNKELELIFANDRDFMQRGLSKIKRNTVY